MSVPNAGTEVDRDPLESAEAAANGRPEGSNSIEERPNRSKVVTGLCGTLYPCAPHALCSGTWMTQAGVAGPCQCWCHPSYDEDEALEVMELEGCPRCGWGWEDHAYDAGRIVCQVNRRRVAWRAE